VVASWEGRELVIEVTEVDVVVELHLDVQHGARHFELVEGPFAVAAGECLSVTPSWPELGSLGAAASAPATVSGAVRVLLSGGHTSRRVPTRLVTLDGAARSAAESAVADLLPTRLRAALAADEGVVATIEPEAVAEALVGEVSR
jgi:hypothetical protein